MANEELTIAKEKARLTVIGNSYPDTLTDSGLGLDLSQIIFDILIDLGLDLPDIDPDDLDDITVIIGIDPDTEIVTLEYPDPDFDPDIDPDDLPDILDYPLPDLDWDDFIDNLEDLGIDPNTLTDLSFTGLNDLGIPELVSLDMDFNIQEDELPASIEIVTPPNKLEYQDGERIDLTGMVVTAKKTDGSTWTSAKYPNGHIPLGELIIEPTQADANQTEVTIYTDGEGVVAATVYANVKETEKNIWGDETSACPDRSKPIPGRGVESFLGAWPDAPGVYLITNYNGTVFGKSLGGLIMACSCTKYINAVYGNYYWFCSSGAGLDSSRWSAIESSGGGFSLHAPVSTSDPSEAGELNPESGVQAISVSWPRYGDGELLSAAFDIEVILRGHGGGR